MLGIVSLSASFSTLSMNTRVCVMQPSKGNVAKRKTLDEVRSLRP